MRKSYEEQWWIKFCGVWILFTENKNNFITIVYVTTTKYIINYEVLQIIMLHTLLLYMVMQYMICCVKTVLWQ